MWRIGTDKQLAEIVRKDGTIEVTTVYYSIEEFVVAASFEEPVVLRPGDKLVLSTEMEYDDFE